jgi:hypothetical protein
MLICFHSTLEQPVAKAASPTTTISLVRQNMAATVRPNLVGHKGNTS